MLLRHCLLYSFVSHKGLNNFYCVCLVRCLKNCCHCCDLFLSATEKRRKKNDRQRWWRQPNIINQIEYNMWTMKRKHKFFSRSNDKKKYQIIRLLFYNLLISVGLVGTGTDRYRHKNESHCDVIGVGVWIVHYLLFFWTWFCGFSGTTLNFNVFVAWWEWDVHRCGIIPSTSTAHSDKISCQFGVL